MTIELEPLGRSGEDARHVAMERLFNVRDLGGYPTVDGCTTRWKTLYRADGIHHASEADPAVFHCAAGKDRTGVLAAVILGLLGVDDDTIAADYGLSKAAMDSLLEWMRANVPESLDAMTDQPAAFLDAPPHAMQRVLEVVRSRYGTMAGYVEAIGVPSPVVTALRDNLLS